MLIPFTQYLLPMGQKRVIDIDIDRQDVIDAARRFTKGGGRFEAEILTTGHVSVTAVVDTGEEGMADIAIRIVPNEPGKVLAAVEELILQADRTVESDGADQDPIPT